MDWGSIISLAEDLHKKEQQQLKKHNTPIHESNNTTNFAHPKNKSRRHAFFEKRRRKKELARRRQFESIGSFSVNILNSDGVSEPPRVKVGSIPTCAGILPQSSEVGIKNLESVDIDIYEDDESLPSLQNHHTSKIK